jgi:hypothetical protein
VNYTSVPSWTYNTQTPATGHIVSRAPSYYIDDMEKWLRANPGRCMTQFQVAAIFGRACCRAASIGNALNGSARAGVWPVDRTVFQDHNFSASTAFQDDSGTSPIETTSSNPGSPSTRVGCSSHISVDTISPLPKAVSTVKISRTYQGTQREAFLNSSPYKHSWSCKKERGRK